MAVWNNNLPMTAGGPPGAGGMIGAYGGGPMGAFSGPPALDKGMGGGGPIGGGSGFFSPGGGGSNDVLSSMYDWSNPGWRKGGNRRAVQKKTTSPQDLAAAGSLRASSYGSGLYSPPAAAITNPFLYF